MTLQPPPFRFDNWLASRACRSDRAVRSRACVVHPLMALTFLVAAALLVTAVVRSGVVDAVRTWTRLAVPTSNLTSHPMALSDLSAPVHSRTH